jgi:hypothetical protein
VTGDIGKNLNSSEAAKSLRMEVRVAKLFERHKWKAETSTYYNDPETGKLRETDVYVSPIFRRTLCHGVV